MLTTGVLSYVVAYGADFDVKSAPYVLVGDVLTAGGHPDLPLSLRNQFCVGYIFQSSFVVPKEEVLH